MVGGGGKNSKKQQNKSLFNHLKLEARWQNMQGVGKKQLYVTHPVTCLKITQNRFLTFVIEDKFLKADLYAIKIMFECNHNMPLFLYLPYHIYFLLLTILKCKTQFNINLMARVQYSFPFLHMNCASFCYLASNRLQEMYNLLQPKT